MARQESYGAIREMLELKRQGQTRGVIVSGCLAEREKDALLEACPGVDRLVGVFGREHVTKMADRLLGRLDEQRSIFQPAPSTPLSDRSRLRITPRHFAYLKISEGCNRLCTFCAIPKMRGKHHTKPMEEVIAEAKELAADGVRELNIVAQDTTYYGIDLYGRPRLAELLRELNQIEGLDSDSPAVSLSGAFHRRTDGGSRRRQQNLALFGHPDSAHQRHDASPDATAGESGSD